MHWQWRLSSNKQYYSISLAFFQPSVKFDLKGKQISNAKVLD